MFTRHIRSIAIIALAAIIALGASSPVNASDQGKAWFADNGANSAGIVVSCVIMPPEAMTLGPDTIVGLLGSAAVTGLSDEYGVDAYRIDNPVPFGPIANPSVWMGGLMGTNAKGETYYIAAGAFLDGMDAFLILGVANNIDDAAMIAYTVGQIVITNGPMIRDQDCGPTDAQLDKAFAGSGIEFERMSKDDGAAI